MIQSLVLRILRLFSENTNGKKFLPWGRLLHSPTEGIFPPTFKKIVFDFTIAIINKCFEFQNDWLTINRIRLNCTQFCPLTLC